MCSKATGNVLISVLLCHLSYMNVYQGNWKCLNLYVTVAPEQHECVSSQLEMFDNWGDCDENIFENKLASSLFVYYIL